MALGPRRKRHQPSTVDQLGPEFVEMIRAWRIDNGWTIKQITEKLTEFDKHISKSAMARHTRDLDDMAAEVRTSREIANALVGRFGDEADSKVSRANIELMHSNILRMMMAAEDGMPIQMSSDTAKEWAQALSALGTARRADVEYVEKLEKRAAEKARAAAVAAIDTVVKRTEGGLSKEMVDAFKREILKVG